MHKISVSWKVARKKLSYVSQTVFCVDIILSLEEILSITTGRCDLAIATHARKMH